MENLTVIDGDSIAYICSKDDLTTSITNVDSILQGILEETGSNLYYLFLSKSPYFRHSVNSEYKAKRPAPTLKYLKTLNAYLIEQYGAIIIKDIEADDLVAYCMKQLSGSYNVISGAIDKDVIGQVPGIHYNYKKNEFHTTTPEEAISFLYKQVLMGDSTDNITGIKGVGEKAVEKLFEGLTTPEEFRNKVIQTYMEKSNGVGDAIFKFQQNFRQVYLLRTEEDFINEVGNVPSLPAPIQFI